MQRIATKIFIGASVAFGVFGILLVFTDGPDGVGASDLNQLLHKLLLTSVCVILPSFALSIAGKYLSK